MESEPTRPEQVATPRPQPRIYVASLSDYNAGRLHGAWIDADQTVDAIEESITRMLDASRMFGAEEWAIHDYQGLGGFPLGEYASLESVSLLGNGIAEHGLAFAAWAAHRGEVGEAAESFCEAFMGEWPSVGDYAAGLLDDYGLEADIDSIVPDGLRAYVQIDAEGLGRDLVIGGDLVAIETGSGSVWIFQGRVG